MSNRNLPKDSKMRENAQSRIAFARAVGQFGAILKSKRLYETIRQIWHPRGRDPGDVGWLARGGINETKTYYKEIREVKAMGAAAVEKSKLRVGGDVEKNSIVRDGKEVRFTLTQNELKLPVVYVGTEPLPDTFRDDSQALADGKMRADGCGGHSHPSQVRLEVRRHPPTKSKIRSTKLEFRFSSGSTSWKTSALWRSSSPSVSRSMPLCERGRKAQSNRVSDT
jgi:hypothetical protein